MGKYLLIIRAHPRLSLAAVLALALIIAGFIFVRATLPKPGPAPTTFGECSALYTVKEGSPRTCSVPWGKTFVEYTGNVPTYQNEIHVTSLPPAAVLTTSPLVVSGEAVPDWFAGGGLIVQLVAGDGSPIGSGTAQKTDAPSTNGFTSFTVSVPFTRPTPGTQGALVFKKGNSTGAALVLPVVY